MVIRREYWSIIVSGLAFGNAGEQASSHGSLAPRAALIELWERECLPVRV